MVIKITARHKTGTVKKDKLNVLVLGLDGFLPASKETQSHSP